VIENDLYNQPETAVRKPSGASRPWLTLEPSTRFSVFRVVLATVLLADICHLFAHLEVFPNLQTFIWPARGILLFWCLALVCMIVGYRTWAATMANYLCCVVMLGSLAPSGGFQQAAADSVSIGLSLLAVLLPCVTGLGIDADADLAFAPVAARWVLAAYLGSVYFDSGVHKLLSPMWLGGFGATTPMGLPSLVWINTGWMSLFPPLLLRFLGWSVVGFELLFIPLYAWRRTRAATLLVGIALHIGIGLLYPIPIFSGLMIAAYCGLLPDSWYRRLGFAHRRSPGTRIDSIAFWNWLTPRHAVLLASLWVVAISISYAPGFVAYRPIWLALKAVRRVIYVTTGVASHAVFEDDGFKHYAYQLRLTAEGPDGVEQTAPYSRSGLISWSIRDRVWEQWWKRTQAPPVPLEQAEANLAKWAAFYWPATDHPQIIRIEARQQAVQMNTIDTGLFLRNYAFPWIPIGTIQMNGGTPPKTTWLDSPTSDESRLGDYVVRVLAQHLK
jgi:hypothetical protein